MNNLLTFVVAHWGAITGAVVAAHAMAIAVANFFPNTKAAAVIETVYDYAMKVVGFAQPFMTRNSQK